MILRAIYVRMATNARVPRYTFATSYSVRGSRGIKRDSERKSETTIGGRNRKIAIGCLGRGMKKRDRSKEEAMCVAIKLVLTRIISEGSNEEAAGQRWNRDPSSFLASSNLLLLLSLSASPSLFLFSSCNSLVAAFTYIIIVMMIMTGHGANGTHGHVAAWQRVSLDAVLLFPSSRYENLLPSGPKKRSPRAVQELVARFNTL